MRKGSADLGRNGTKDTVENALNLDILDLQKKGFLALAAGFSWRIEWSSNGKSCDSVGYVLEKRGDTLVRRTRPAEDTSVSWRGLTLGPITDERRRDLGLGRGVGGPASDQVVDHR